jgi:hypothetical protein
MFWVHHFQPACCSINLQPRRLSFPRFPIFAQTSCRIPSPVWSAILSLLSQGYVPAPWLVYLAVTTRDTDERNVIVFLVSVTPLAHPDAAYYERISSSGAQRIRAQSSNPNLFSSTECSNGKQQLFNWHQRHLGITVRALSGSKSSCIHPYFRSPRLYSWGAVDTFYTSRRPLRELSAWSVLAPLKNVMACVAYVRLCMSVVIFKFTYLTACVS